MKCAYDLTILILAKVRKKNCIVIIWMLKNGQNNLKKFGI